jgi:acyl carrier protein
VTLEDKIRDILGKRGGMAATIGSVPRDANLYEAGLTSLSTVQIMLSLEEEFDVEFPESMLNRNSFASISEIQRRIEALVTKRV